MLRYSFVDDVGTVLNPILLEDVGPIEFAAVDKAGGAAQQRRPGPERQSSS